MSSEYGYWVGFNDQEVEGSFVWTDNSPYDYENWHEGQPNGDTTANCVDIYGDGGEWYDQDCFPPQFGPVCKYMRYPVSIEIVAP